MNYIGSKYSLLNFLDESISTVTEGQKARFLDLFAGTGAVGTHFKKQGYPVIANDIQYYSYVLNRHYIGNNQPLQFRHLQSEIPELKSISQDERPATVCRYLSELDGFFGFIFKNYSLAGSQGSPWPRQYFSDENAALCDAVRQKIEVWKSAKLITDDEYFFLLTCLVESADRYANTASVYGAFLKQLKKSAQKKLEIRPVEIIPSTEPSQVFCQDVNQLITQLEGEILYLDPPYNQRQYATNYHLLETLARYDSPAVYGKTGLREYQKQKSLYAQRSQVKAAFEFLIKSARVKYIFLSYNNEGLLTADDIAGIMSSRGRYGYFTQDYARFRADKSHSRNYKASVTTEYLHFVVVR